VDELHHGLVALPAPDADGELLQLLHGGTLAWSVLFPLAWLAYTLLRGPVVTWYPYPFIDVITHGYVRVVANVLVVAALLIGLGTVFVALDRRLPQAPVQR
jgi:hypothetical protein